MQINVSVTDANNIVCEVVPPQQQTITIDRGVAGNGIVSIVPVTISTFQYLRITYTNGTVQDVGPLTSTAYTATAPITIVGNTISLATVPVASGGTGLTSLTAGYIPFGNNTSAFGSSANLFWDSANSRLGIGTNSPTAPLHVSGANLSTSAFKFVSTTGTNAVLGQFTNSGGTAYIGLDSDTGVFGGVRYSLNLWNAGAYPIVFGTSNTERMRLDSEGTLAVGVPPSNWAVLKAIQIGYSSLATQTANTYLNNNTYFNGTSWAYSTSAASGKYQINGNVHSWHTAPSGTLDNVITFTQAMTLDASGNLGIGTISPAAKLDVTANNPIMGYFRSSGGSANDKRLTITSGGDRIVLDSAFNSTGASAAFSFTLGGTEGMRLTTTGLGIGTSSPGASLHVAGAISSTPTGSGFLAGLQGNYAVAHLNGTDGSLIDFSVSGSDARGRIFYVNSTNEMGFGTTNGVIKMTLDGVGNLGLGVTPSAWSSIFKAYQVGSGIGTAFMAGRSDAGSAQNQLGANAYFDGSWKYVATGVASRYEQSSSIHSWHNAPSGTAGPTTSIVTGRVYTVTTLGSTTLGQWQSFFSALVALPTVNQSITATATGTLLGGATVTQSITFTQAMTLDVSGNLLVGGTSDAALDGAFGIVVGGSSKSSGGVAIESSTSQWMTYTNSQQAYIFYDARQNAERARIDLNGNFGIGTSSPAAKLDVTGGSSTGGFIVNGSIASVRASSTVVDIGDGNRIMALGPNTTTAGTFKFIVASSNASVYTTAATIDSSGNLGLGVTPSAWAGASVNYNTFQFGISSVTNVANSAAEFSYNQYIDSSGTRRYIASNTALYYRIGNTQHQWFTAASGTAGNAITFTQAMTLDADGDLGIGTTNPTTKLHVSSSGFNVATFNSTFGQMAISFANSGTIFSQIGSGLSVSATGGANDLGLGTNGSATANIIFATGASYTERMRLNSSGNLGLGVVPSAWGSYNGALDLKGGGALGAFNNSTALFNNSYYNGTNYIYKASTGAALYQMAGNVHQWFNAASGLANTTTIVSGGSYAVAALGSSTLAQWQAFFSGLASLPTVGQSITATATGTLAGGGTVSQAISFTQAMTLDASGNLGVGTTSPVSKFAVSNGTTRLETSPSTSSVTVQALNEARTATTELLSAGSILTYWTGAAGSQAERMRLDGAGNLGLGVTSRVVSNYTSFGVNGSSGSLIDLYTNGTRVATFGADTTVAFGSVTDIPVRFTQNNTEGMRLTSTGLGIGTTSPATKLDVATPSGTAALISTTITGAQRWQFGVEEVNGNYVIKNQTGGTTPVVISTGGNLGLGVTPSAWSSSFKAMQVGAVGALWSSTGTAGSWLSRNNFFDGSAFKYLQTSFAQAYEMASDGSHKFYTAPSGTAGTTASLTQAMTLTAEGNLGIGSTSPTNLSNYKTITMNATTGSIIDLQSAGTTLGRIQTDTTYSLALWTATATPMVFGTNYTERARIDSSGNLLVGTTSVLTSGKFSVEFNGTNNNGIVLNDTVPAAHVNYALFQITGTTIGSIARVGATSAVIYNTTSDYRLKTVVGAVTGQGARIDALKPVDYLWTESGQQARGFLAHEFQQVYANSVNGTKDAVDENGNPKYQSMQAGSSEVIADLVAEIQSLRKRLADAGI